MQEFFQNPQTEEFGADKPFTVSTPMHLTTQMQEFSIMVSALKHVVSFGNNPSENPVATSPYQLASTSTGTQFGQAQAHNQLLEISLPDATCEYCKIEGCLGCSFFEGGSESNEKKKKKKKKYRGEGRGTEGGGRRRFGTRIGRPPCGWGPSPPRRRQPGPTTGPPSDSAESQPRLTSPCLTTTSI